MSTPYGGADPDQGWSGAGQGPGAGEPSPPPEQPPPGRQPGLASQGAYGEPDTGVQPDDGQPYGQASRELAGFWIRFAGALIDGIILSVVNTIVSLVLDRTTSQAVVVLISLGYFTYFHGSTGQTLGNRALSIKVIDATQGGTIGYGRAFVRWLVSIVSALVVLLGYLWMLWDPNNQTWHDKAAKSIVVKVS